MEIAVSVIIPVYNSEKNIHRCLDSILAQTLKEIEVICVDDGSTDASAQILDDYAKNDSRIRVIHQENAGAGAARNRGISYATGKYLSILDADDFFDPEMLSLSYRKAEAKRADIVVFSCDMYDDENDCFRPCDYSIRKYLLPVKEPFSVFDVKQDVFKLFIGWAWDKLFRTEFIRQNDFTFQVQRTTNDMLFVFSAIMRAQRIVTMPEVLAHYRRGNGSLSVTREKSWKCFYDALIALKEKLVDWNIYKRFEQDYINYALNFSLWNLNTLCEPTHTLLLEKLRDEWFETLGINGHPADYFYNHNEYNQYLCIMGIASEESLTVTQPGDSLFHRAYICLKYNGLRYTIRKVLEKIIIKITGNQNAKS